MKLTIVVLLAAVNLMVSADVTSDENVAKGKREAPMAEPSTDYTPPRLEAPYATFSPIVSGSAPQAAYYQSSNFNQGPLVPSSPPYEYNRYAGVIPLSSVDSNDLGNEQNPGPPYSQGYNAGYSGLSGGYATINGNGGNGGNGANGPNGPNGANGANGANGGNGYGGTNPYGTFFKYSQNSQGGPATSYAQLNGLSHGLTVYGGTGSVYDNNAGNFEQYSNIKSPFGNSGANFENSFYGNPSFGSAEGKFPSSAALVSNEPIYASGAKSLRHYNSQPSSALNTQILKNSRPVALTPPHLQRKPPTFLSDAKNPNFRPSFLLGQSVLSSTPEYGQPTLTSLGTTNKYLPPTQSIPEQQYPQQYQFPQQYSAPQTLGSLPLTQSEYLSSQPNFANSYQTSDNIGPSPPSTSYGLPETVIYTKSSLFGERYGPSQ